MQTVTKVIVDAITPSNRRILMILDADDSRVNGGGYGVGQVLGVRTTQLEYWPERNMKGRRRAKTRSLFVGNDGCTYLVNVKRERAVCIAG